MTLIWPSSLPQSPLIDPFTERPAQLTIRTANEAGPAKTRRRTTAGARPLTLSFVMTADQLAAFETFFYGTIAGGALSFQFTHPRTRAAVMIRIVDASQGESSLLYKPFGASRWIVSFKAEVMP